MQQLHSSGPSIRLSRPVMSAMVICGLVLLLQVPIALIRGVIAERVTTRSEALIEVTELWGGAQSIVGPRLVVPVRDDTHALGFATDGEAGGSPEFATFLPTSLAVRADLATETLSRGLFAVPVYRARVTLRGTFEQLDLTALGLAAEDLRWDRAALSVEVTDPKSVGSQSVLSWNGVSADFLPGAATGVDELPGIHRPVPLSAGTPADFEISLELKGSESIWFVPFSRETDVSLHSNWSAPSFAGAWLPTERQLDDDGFSAEWSVPFLGRNYPQQWASGDSPLGEISASRFGVELISPVDHYRMSERSTKYASLFLVLTFGMLWLFDAMAGVRIHPIQYLLIGAAMCLFYLLELSLSEHVGFMGAYTAASMSVAGLVATYSVAVLRSVGRGIVVAGVLGLLYAYLLALLSLEHYALLAGSMGLFLALAAVMYLTRWIDWYRAGAAG